MPKLPKELALGLAIVATATSYLGLGMPNHAYQISLSIITLLICYHRKWIAPPKQAIDYALAALNFAVLAMQYKLLIGGGIRAPFSWMKIPVPTTEASANWFQWLPRVGVDWQSIALTEWQLDLTVVQSFLLLITGLAGWVRFQPFASFALALLLVVSLPSYVDFHWNWLLPALAASLLSFYVQAHSTKKAQVP